ncbi:MAG TPA: Vms1/Ankzf1 family peptidyl-tRNA hydrolase [Pyrinomonadaceae bacterium]|nr:Vms1/Ankzf1 family peptidyl-tRNA hydrolase [Pyrinomonadaceae bacterium]
MADAPKEIAKQATETTNPEKLLNKLLEFEPAAAPVLSLYLDARADEHGKRNFMPYVRKQLNERAKSYELRTPERESFDQDAERIMAYLENGIEPALNGVAIFACSAANNYFEVGTFEAPFTRNRLFVSDRPHVYPLARVIDEYRRYAVVLADTNRARIFVFATGRAVEEESVENVKTKRTSVGGWSQARYQRHEENYHLHHIKEVINVLERVVSEEGIEQIILAGDEETVVPLFREQLPQTLSEKVIDAVSLSINTPEHELLEETAKVFKRHDSLTDSEKVERLLNEYRADDLGVAGVPDTLAALSNGQVEEMLISASANNLVYDEEEVKKVLKLYEPDQPLTEELNQRIVADELVRRANLLSSARVTFIEDDERLKQLGGVGGLLRYRISDESAVVYEEGSAAPRSQALTTKA